VQSCIKFCTEHNFFVIEQYSNTSSTTRKVSFSFCTQKKPNLIFGAFKFKLGCFLLQGKVGPDFGGTGRGKEAQGQVEKRGKEAKKRGHATQTAATAGNTTRNATTSARGVDWAHRGRAVTCFIGSLEQPAQMRDVRRRVCDVSSVGRQSIA
jgi:hypothetical protein